MEHPTAINNKGQAVGFANPSGGEDAPFNPIAFYWTQGTGMQNLGTLSGDTNSLAYAINIQGQIVGQSYGGAEGSHAFIYQNGAMTDLNSLKIGHGSLTLVYANDVNDYGVIVGGAYDTKTGKAPFSDGKVCCWSSLTRACSAARTNNHILDFP